jgi:hypothetical protein
MSTKYKLIRSLIVAKHNDVTFVERKNSFWVSCFNLAKILETKDFPQCFSFVFKIGGVNYYSIDNLLYFLRSSKNPHHIIDYLIPLGWTYTDSPLLDVVQLFDKYGIRGYYNFDMSKCSQCLNFTVTYYYHCPIPILIDVVDEEPDIMRQKLYEMFEAQRCRCIIIDTNDWYTKINCLKETYLFHVESHLTKLHAIEFMSKIIKDSENLKELVEDLGEDVVDACCENRKFPFPLSKCLTQFGIVKSDSKYNEIFSLFDSDKNVQMQNSNNTILEPIDELDDIDDIDELDDIEENEIDEISNLDNNEDLMFDEIVQHNGNTLYIEGIDYIIENDDYYLNHPTLVKIAIRSGIRSAEKFVDDSWKLIDYINTFGKKAYESLLKTMNIAMDERKQMFRLSNNVIEQERIVELENARQKIKEMESYMDISKRTKEIEKYVKKSLNCKVSETNITEVKSDSTINDDISPNEKKPTKVLKPTIKTGSIVNVTTDPIKDDELEIFLGR